MERYRVGGCRMRRSYQASFIPRGVTAEEAKWLGSANAVKRHSKNDFMRHPTPHTTRPIHRGNTTIVSEMGPMIDVGSTKAQGSKAKPVYGSEPPRATRARDEATQRIANILAHSVPHRGDLAFSSFISESKPEGFLHTPMWAGI
jgi:hypothetical protein